MRKWFLCFHPGNGCISMAAAAIYHYVNVTRAPIFYVLSANAQSSLQHRSSLLRFNWACCLPKGLKKTKNKTKQSSSNVFWDFYIYFFLAKQQTFSVWKTQAWGDVLEQTARTNRASYLTVVLKECPCLVLIYWSYVLLGVTVVLETFVIKVVVGPWLLKETW